MRNQIRKDSADFTELHGNLLMRITAKRWFHDPIA
jgi:hypothetical protein